MGLYKIFKDIFNETMSRHGFFYQGNVFIRITGKDIIQAVTIKPIVGYEITAAIFPLYAPPPLFYGNVDAKKPYWAEDRRLKFNDFIDFPHTKCIIYLDGEEEKKMYSLTPFLNKTEFLNYTVENLQKAAEVMESFYIPQFDKIVDLNSYFDWVNTDIKERSIGSSEIVSANVLVYKSYLDGNYERGNLYIDNCRVENAEFAWKVFGCDKKKFQEQDFAEKFLEHLKHNKDLSQINGLNDKFKKCCEDYEKILNERYKDFFDSEKNNDLSWILDHVNRERLSVYKILKEKYSKLPSISF